MAVLEGKVAIITGAASGFGRATAELFATEGAKIVAVDYAADAVTEVVKGITEQGGEAVAVRADVSQEADVEAAVKTAVDTYCQVDVLFNNAGIYLPGAADEVSAADWERTVAVNLTGAFLGTKHAIGELKKTKGTIINTASAAALIGFPSAVAYAASKGGVQAMTTACAVDFAQDGVRVNCICPGTGETGLTKEVLANPELAEAFLGPIPLKRFAQPADVAHAALYLASPGAGYVTGVSLPVDGGWTIS
ncbi:SDR family NAD(P)-dependent oxidoreductase [Brachybacterium sp. Marseille-Q7125]|uniref:SDR family NAD(P)-dependent oxidoreductase n=1 Tax=Brachybacterium sp. Marseille-Q7125 TaxID=2932815 RepID=UPI001FF2EB13|nr:SDR family NAD(P)-dependent oxidoreductase [Brachybacterium sp. Marseille-Q7125]